MAERAVQSIILAAGKSTRMKTSRTKVLHEVCGRPILEWVLEACRAAGVKRHVVVVGGDRDQIQAAFPDADDLVWVVQEPQQGTGHAVMVAGEVLGDFAGDVVILMGDAPLVRPETVRTLLETHREQEAAVTLATAVLDDPKWFGRILRDAEGNLLGIVEARDASPEQLAIREVNPAFYCFRWQALAAVLPRIGNENAKGEYYLTDAVGLLIGDGRKAVAVPAADPSECEAVNTRADLARVTAVARQRIAASLMEAGVTLVDPATAYIDAGVRIGPDTVVGPCTVIRGPSTIGAGCRVGPLACVPAGTVLEDGAVWGPGRLADTATARADRGEGE